ncbi:MAG TPA: SDR family NAD(P)-dependent oxidoreductase [Solirubrobacterales bacterium]|nr:SDR family NAD(P)-dependent oxidoreductase [Solirubrobacterales bacterium]
MHQPDLSGRVAAITGASSGIGEATAVTLARAGAAVSLAARRSDRIDQLAERIESEGGRALAIETDVTDEEQANEFVRRTKDELGRLDVLVNNAGVMLLGPVIGADTSEWRRMIEVNLLGLLYCTHAALPIMGEQGSGHIVNVSSVAGRFANLGSAVYNLTKFGVNAFSEALRQEVVGANVKVTVIEPGMVETELLSHNTHPMVLEAAQRMREEVGTPLTSEDIAEAILYAVGGPERVAVNEVLVRPAGQRR